VERRGKRRDLLRLLRFQKRLRVEIKATRLGCGPPANTDDAAGGSGQILLMPAIVLLEQNEGRESGGREFDIACDVIIAFPAPTDPKDLRKNTEELRRAELLLRGLLVVLEPLADFTVTMSGAGRTCPSFGMVSTNHEAPHSPLVPRPLSASYLASVISIDPCALSRRHDKLYKNTTNPDP